MPRRSRLSLPGEERRGGCAVRREAEEGAVEWRGQEARAEIGLALRFSPVAVAHHRDDQAETILHNLCRRRTSGLGGMQPVRGRIIRPLLAVSREILSGFQAQGLSLRGLHQPLGLHYTRNRIRRQLVPLLREQVNCAVDSICGWGGWRPRRTDYLASQAGRW